MAKAYERASKRVDAVSEALLAELIQRDVQQLTEDALGGLMVLLHICTLSIAYCFGRLASSKLVCGLRSRREGRHGVPPAPAFCSPPYAASSTVSV